MLRDPSFLYLATILTPILLGIIIWKSDKFPEPGKFLVASFLLGVSIIFPLDLFIKISEDHIAPLLGIDLDTITAWNGALVAESGSTIVRVNLRKKQKLYINDGTYGTLFDAGTPNIVYPSRLIKSGKAISKKLTAFDFYGPTCDSMDYMKGPFLLPNNIKENDYIELGQLGAYGLTFRTQFNGFYSNEIYEVEDEPIMTCYSNH